VQLQPFTYCDPDDPNAASASSAAGCTGGAGGANDENRLPLGPEAGETRYSATTPYDNVSDYNTFSMTGILDLTGAPITDSGVTRRASPSSTRPWGDPGKRFASHHGDRAWADGTNTTVVLDGYRVRYAPNALP